MFSSYRSGLVAALGTVLGAGAILALVDVIHAGGGPLAIPGLWALLALPLALATGLVLGAGNATWGDGFLGRFLRRLRADRDFDRNCAAALIAAGVVGAVLAFGVSKLAMGFVANVERKPVGAQLLGVVTVALVPILAVLSLPLYRGARYVALAVPANGPLSRVVVLVVGVAALVAAAGAFVVFRRLDYQSLDLLGLVLPALLPVVAIIVAALAYGPLGGLRERLPRRGVLAAGAAVIAVLVPAVGLSGRPSDATVAAVTERSFVGPRMIAALRNHSDHDGDGYSAFFGGPDCNDDNPEVHPGAREIAGDGIDNNCVGGDAPLDPNDKPTPVERPDAGVGSGGSAAAAPAPTASGGDNVVIIFVDTLRFDHLGLAGYQRAGASLTPHLDAFAKQAVVFKRAFSQAPNTPRSVPSFLSSRYPSQVKFDKVFQNYPSILDANDLLFEALHDAGLHTVGESSHFYFCDHVRYPDVCADFPKRMHANALQGADDWDNSLATDIPPSNHDSAGPRIVKKTLAKLDDLAMKKQRFALLVHLFEPHSTYMEHPGYKYVEHGTASLVEKYDYEIAFEDDLIGQLLDQLDKSGLAATTTVVVMADHGEAFGAHSVYGQADFFHGDSLYTELTHVPLMFRVPGIKPCMADDVVQLIDMAPTITALLGAKPPASWVGRSLVPAFACTPGALTPKPAFSELLPAPEWDHEAKAMVTADGKRHVYYRTSDAKWEIYDLEADPEEKKNIADSDPAAKDLQQKLAQWIEGPLVAGGGK